MQISLIKILKYGAYRSIPNDQIIERQRYVLFAIYTLAFLALYVMMSLGGIVKSSTSILSFAVFTCVAVTLVLNYLMVQVHKYHELAYSISIFCGLVLIHSFSYEFGGVRNPDLMYLGIIVLYSYIVLGNHGGRIALFLSLANIIFFYILSDFSEPGKYINYEIGDEIINLNHLIAAVSSMVLITALSLYLLFTKNKTIQKIEESKDILEFKNEELQELSLVAQETGNSIVITSETGIIQWVNTGFTRLTGFSLEESVGKRMSEFLYGPLTDQSIGHILSTCRFDTNSFNTELIKYKKNGERAWVEESVTKVFDEDELVTKFIFIESDVTERKSSEKQMREYLRNLESTNKELDKFAYVVSHDLKAPLRAIGNLTGWIEEDAGHMLPDMVRKNFNLIKNRVIRMESLINGILDYSKAAKSENQYENIDLNEVVHNSFDLLGQPSDCEIKIKEQLPMIFTDRSKINQVILNLVSNAVKFNDRKNKIIEVKCIDEDDHYKIGITDNGPGIDSKFHDKIFKIFQTLNTRDEFESSGVGLAIVKKILDEEGGKIWLESEIEKGTTFYFTLPKSAIDSEATSTLQNA